MATNGNGHNGPHDKWHKFGPEVGAFWIAEGISMAVMPVGMFLMDQLPSSLMKCASKTLGKCLEPVIEPFEKGLSYVCKLEACKPDLTKSRAERAERLARVIMVAAPPALLAFGMKQQLRRRLNMKWEVPNPSGVADPKWWKPWEGLNPFQMTKKEWMVVLTDDVAHGIFMGAVQMPFAPEADKGIGILKSAFKKMGMSDRTAHDIGAGLVINEIPNFAAGITATGGLAARRMIWGANGHTHP